MSFSLVGNVWTPEMFGEYLDSLGSLKWAKSVTIHHTAMPNLALRPNGFTIQHIRNIQDFYQNKKGWSRGPHLFTDDDQIFGMSPLTERGIHAVSFNKDSIGIEALGDFDNESPKSGRGKQVMETTAAATKLLLEKLGLKPSTSSIKFHRDDPETRKTCPGRKIEKDWFVDLVKGPSAEPKPGPKGEQPPKPNIPGWSKFVFEGGEWCVPVIAFLHHLGDGQAPKLKSKDGMFFYDGDLIEGAYYDKEKEETWAPFRELQEMA